MKFPLQFTNDPKTPRKHACMRISIPTANIPLICTTKGEQQANRNSFIFGSEMCYAVLGRDFPY